MHKQALKLLQTSAKLSSNYKESSKLQTFQVHWKSQLAVRGTAIQATVARLQDVHANLQVYELQLLQIRVDVTGWTAARSERLGAEDLKVSASSASPPRRA